MRHFVVYHNPDVMPYPADEVSELSVYSNKMVSDLPGDRIWLLTGSDRPRKFYLVSTFVVDEVDTSGREGFQLKASGTKGRIFKPFPRLDALPWFDELKRAQGNFAFGLQPITQPAVIAGLNGVAEAAGGY